MLTYSDESQGVRAANGGEARVFDSKVLTLLALLVQKYKY
jgi:hypothetical protein